jgi:anti-sigma regulatory factor (Ser/Thr protein kinase)
MAAHVTDRLEVEAHTRNLAAVRQFLHAAIRRSSLPRRDVNKVVLAVDEAVANTIRHGYESGSGNVEVLVDADDEKFTVKVRDTGQVYDVAKRAEEAATFDLQAHIAAGHRHGLGLFIMRRVMDEVRYSSRAGEPNELTLVKYIAREQEPQAQARG